MSDTITIESSGDPSVGIYATYWQINDLNLDHLDGSEVEEMLTELRRFFERWICDDATAYIENEPATDEIKNDFAGWVSNQLE